MSRAQDAHRISEALAASLFNMSWAAEELAKAYSMTGKDRRVASVNFADGQMSLMPTNDGHAVLSVTARIETGRGPQRAG